MRESKVWIYGMFDLDNYGDCLFPLIARHKLNERNIEVTAVSITGKPAKYKDALRSISREEARNLMRKNDVVLIGGGAVLHDQPLTFFEDSKKWGHEFNGKELWIGAMQDARGRGAKVAFNAPGAIGRLKLSTKNEFRQLREREDYINTRERKGGLVLGESEAGLVPDTACDPDLGSILRYGEKSKESSGTLLVCLRRRSFNGIQKKEAFETIQRLAKRMNLEIKLMPLSDSHQDEKTCEMIGKGIEMQVEIINPASLVEIYAEIRRAKLVLTSSLHAYITAVQCQTRVILVKRPAYHKFEECRSQLRGNDPDIKEWRDLDDYELYSDVAMKQLGECEAKLNAHWNLIADITSGKE